MAEYIEREAVLNRLSKVCITDDGFGMGVQFGVEHAMDVIKEASAADVVEVVHGEWRTFGKRGIYGYMYACSKCDAMYDGRSPYCPNCGAKMDGERKD